MVFPSNAKSVFSLFCTLHFALCTFRVLIPAVYKKDTHLELHFFNNCFDDDHSKGTYTPQSKITDPWMNICVTSNIILWILNPDGHNMQRQMNITALCMDIQ